MPNYRETDKVKHEHINEKIRTNIARLNNHGERLDKLEQANVAHGKDNLYLRETIISLKTSIDLLVDEIANLKYKPLKKYEQIFIIIISALIGFFINHITLKGF